MTTGERIPYLLTKLKAPRIGERLGPVAELAREEGWPYERFLETLLEAEVFARDASGARQRTKAAGFPAMKSLEDFDWTAQPSAERPMIEHLAGLSWVVEAANVCFLGPPGTGKSHLAIALGVKACQAGYRVAFATAQDWVARLEAASERNSLEAWTRSKRTGAPSANDRVSSSSSRTQNASATATIAHTHMSAHAQRRLGRVFGAWLSTSS